MPLTFKWQDPPVKTPPDEYDVIVQKLKKQPGKWALVMTETYTSSGNVFKKRGCEIKTSSIGTNYSNGKCDVYVRWNVEEND